MKYIRLTGTRDTELLTLLNNPIYANYRVITIMRLGMEDVAYLEKDVSVVKSSDLTETKPLKQRKKND